MLSRRWIRWRNLAAAALAGGALLVAACGGDYAGDGGSSGNIETDREASAVGAPAADEAVSSNVDATGGEQLSQPRSRTAKSCVQPRSSCRWKTSSALSSRSTMSPRPRAASSPHRTCSSIQAVTAAPK
jgi:hypothetical protein